MKNTITVTESIFINRSPERVWDFTQDYSKRTLWDKTILQASVITLKPNRLIQITAKGNLHCKFQYKQDDRPFRTSLAMTDVHSSLIEGGGGSWKYESSGKGTLWTQTNTIILKHNFWLLLLKSFMASSLKRTTRQGMMRAKEMIEK